jgi:hypothetical protein
VYIEHAWILEYLKACIRKIFYEQRSLQPEDNIVVVFTLQSFENGHVKLDMHSQQQLKKECHSGNNSAIPTIPVTQEFLVVMPEPG